MSHLRDLQRLRNTRHNFQIKKNVNSNQPAELRLGHNNYPQTYRQSHAQDPIFVQEVLGKNFEVDPDRDAGDSYSKYLQFKEIFTSR